MPCHFSLLIEFRDHRGLDGDLQAEGDRRRTLLRAAAQRRTAAGRLFWLARGMGKAQGKKVSPPPLRHRRSRRLPSFGQITPSEAVWLAGPTATQGEDVADIVSAAQDATVVRRKKRNPGAPIGCRERPEPGSATPGGNIILQRAGEGRVSKSKRFPGGGSVCGHASTGPRTARRTAV